MKRAGIGFALLMTAALVLASWGHRLPVGPTEMLGVLAGAWGVWLTAEESLWNWPVGIAGSLLFAALFFQSQLYGSMAMQLLNVVLGLVGWYWWRHGGRQHSPLTISRASPTTLFTLAATIAVALPLMVVVLGHTHDPAPVRDALALVLSLAAQYLVTKKLMEHWHVSIAADIVSISLFLSQGLYFIGAMLAMHLGMCVFGLWQWRRTLVSEVAARPAAEAVPGLSRHISS
jgi:nicotinamide mononucleotide transporter